MSAYLADAVLVIHGLFIIFVVLGGLLVFRWRNIIWLHIPCAVYGVLLEFFGWICPLTYLENYLRQDNSYEESFIEHYLLPVIYPTALTPAIQVWLGVSVIVINLIVYSLLWRRMLMNNNKAIEN